MAWGTACHCSFKILLVLFITLMAINMSLGKTVFLLPSNQNGINEQCQPAKRELLLQKLGRAYNHHFMAMDFVDLTTKTADQLESLPEDALHESRYGSANESIREKRSSATKPAAWTCQTTSKWIDMGRNYFPRYYKTVKCSSNDCWFGHFRCRAKFFQFQILKRKSGACRKVISSSGVPSFEEFWELHEVDTALYCMCTN
ncbi:uncharacterized protein LOC116295850 isoform X2 [Actinia tenebrosa]|uniref:Uncharacterized protein LOC116295850 isoform X2 n=1 Tax=Actinia tenebrosa TaxID=6105 RepID=A0A6P8I419_ACTTE|nr:uncharacterized protein LOC116295850 isoform X2 [Actinia tenebrosa]